MRRQSDCFNLYRSIASLVWLARGGWFVGMPIGVNAGVLPGSVSIWSVEVIMQRNSKRLSTLAGRVGPVGSVLSSPEKHGGTGIDGWQAYRKARGGDR